MATKKKKASKKTASKKTAAKKTAAKKAPAASKKASKKAKRTGPKPRTQGEVKSLLQEKLGLTPKQTREMLTTLHDIVVEDLRTRGKITIPMIGRFVAKHRPARPERKGTNPFTGEETTFKARPATTVAKIYPVKALKVAVSGGE